MSINEYVFRSRASRYEVLVMLSATKWVFINAELNMNETKLQSAVAIFEVFSQFSESISHI